MTRKPANEVDSNRVSAVGCRRRADGRTLTGVAIVVRLIWIALAIVHVLPIWRVGSELFGGNGGVASFVLVLLAQGFFVLKACDVRWLRLPCRHGTLLTLLLLTLIGHGGDVAARSVEQMPMLLPAATVMVAGAAGVSILRRRRLTLAGGSCFIARLRLALNQLATILLAQPAVRGVSVAATPCIGGRAPPLNSSGS